MRRLLNFDTGAHWELDPSVAVRPEPFGALAYHYGSRRLTFLRSKLLADLVVSLGGYASLDEAVEERVPPPSRDRYVNALEDLAVSGFIRAC